LIAGESGSVKSSLLNCLSGLIPHVIPGRIDGSVWLKGTDIREVPSWQLGKELAMVFQQPEDQFLALGVSEELPFAPINHGVSPDRIRSDMDRAARDMAIESLLPKREVKSYGWYTRIPITGSSCRTPFRRSCFL
jgi:energy-coupling factor transport system ATP-binding protein